MKKASLIALVSVALLALLQLYNVIESFTKYMEYMSAFTLALRVVYFIAYCGLAYFFFKLFKQQR